MKKKILLTGLLSLCAVCVCSTGIVASKVGALNVLKGYKEEKTMICDAHPTLFGTTCGGEDISYFGPSSWPSLSSYWNISKATALRYAYQSSDSQKTQLSGYAIRFGSSANATPYIRITLESGYTADYIYVFCKPADSTQTVPLRAGIGGYSSDTYLNADVQTVAASTEFARYDFDLGGEATSNITIGIKDSNNLLYISGISLRIWQTKTN